MMIRNYIKVSFRKFLRQKLYSILNIIGLATGLATVILILLYVSDEWNVDRFHKDHHRIYRVVENQFYSGQPVFPVAVTPGPLAPSLRQSFQEIEEVARFNPVSILFQMGDKISDERGAFIDPEFLKIFSFPMISGDPDKALKGTQVIVISEGMARKFFNDQDPIGKTIKMGKENEMMVTGVMKDFPANSHMRAEYLLSMDMLRTFWDGLDTQWGSNSLYTFVKLRDDVNTKEFNEKIKDHIKSNYEDSSTEIYLQPLTDIHLSTVDFAADNGGRGNKQYVQMFAAIAILILIIACINFMNLSTARSMKRAKEVGLRKAVGADRSLLIVQFLSESIFVALVAMIIAVLMVDLLLPEFNLITGKKLEFTIFQSDGIMLQLLIGLIAASVFTGIIAGSYPAIFLSKFQPANVLKGNLQTQAKGRSFRKVLVVLQFSASIVMIVGAMVVYRQMRFIQNRNLGYVKENVVYIPILSEDFETFKTELLKFPEISGVTSTNQHPSFVMNSSSGFEWPGSDPEADILFHQQGVDPDYIQTMKIEILQGRAFSSDIKSDTGKSIIINEEAMHTMGMKDPVGEKIRTGDEEYEIVGVAKNFHFKTIHRAIEPLFLYCRALSITDGKILIRIREGDPRDAIERIESEWKKFNPGQEFVFRFLDDEFNEIYQGEARTGKLFRYFSMLAVLISCLGLFGLASFTVEQRNKELGIRKVFGASVSRLFYLVSREFTILVLIAFVFSVPVSWFWMSKWLNGFAYRTEMEFSVFLISGFVVLLVALMTVTYQSLRAARVNPIDVLRNE